MTVNITGPNHYRLSLEYWYNLSGKRSVGQLKEMKGEKKQQSDGKRYTGSKRLYFDCDNTYRSSTCLPTRMTVTRACANWNEVAALKVLREETA